MAEFTTIRRGDFLVPADADSIDELRKLPQGKPLRSKVVQPRNYQFLKKAMALIKLAFSYWQPSSYVTAVEQSTVRSLADYLCNNGLDAEAVSNLCTGFLQHLNARREERVDAEKSIDEFRAWVTVKAGYYHEVMTPAGPKRIPKSWAFANMSEDEFGRMYGQLMNVCWKLVLSQTFESPEAAEAAADQLIHFDG